VECWLLQDGRLVSRTNCKDKWIETRPSNRRGEEKVQGKKSPQEAHPNIDFQGAKNLVSYISAGFDALPCPSQFEPRTLWQSWLAFHGVKIRWKEKTTVEIWRYTVSHDDYSEWRNLYTIQKPKCSNRRSQKTIRTLVARGTEVRPVVEQSLHALTSADACHNPGHTPACLIDIIPRSPWLDYGVLESFDAYRQSEVACRINTCKYFVKLG
jgi:hypothetical protein